MVLVFESETITLTEKIKIMIKYKAVFKEVQRVEIAKETAKQVVLMRNGYDGKPLREAKVTSWYSYHETFEDAKTAIVDGAVSDIRKLKEALARAEKHLMDANSLENK